MSEPRTLYIAVVVSAEPMPFRAPVELDAELLRGRDRTQAIAVAEEAACRELRDRIAELVPEGVGWPVWRASEGVDR